MVPAPPRPQESAAGSRIFLSMGIMALLIVLVAVAGRMGLSHLLETTQEVLVHDAHVSEEALEARAATLELRRFEKDYFLNIGAPEKQAEYMEKWKKAHAELVSHLDALDGSVASDDDHATLRDMRANLAAYTGGFEKVSSAVRAGDIATPQAANLAFVPYKDAVRALEATADAIGSTSGDRMKARLALLRAETADTSRTMTAMALLALLVTVIVAFRVRGALRDP